MIFTIAREPGDAVTPVIWIWSPSIRPWAALQVITAGFAVLTPDTVQPKAPVAACALPDSRTRGVAAKLAHASRDNTAKTANVRFRFMFVTFTLARG